jgi:hypothetical protein
VVYIKGLTSGHVLSLIDVHKKGINGLDDIIGRHNKKKKIYLKMWFTQKALP